MNGQKRNRLDDYEGVRTWLWRYFQHGLTYGRYGSVWGTADYFLERGLPEGLVTAIRARCTTRFLDSGETWIAGSDIDAANDITESYIVANKDELSRDLERIASTVVLTGHIYGAERRVEEGTRSRFNRIMKTTKEEGEAMLSELMVKQDDPL